MMDGGLSQLFQEHFKTFHWQRIETAAIGAGIPDINYCCEGFEGWLELKFVKGWRVDLRPEQHAWINRRIRAGGNVNIAVRRTTVKGPRRGPASDELWIYCGCKSEQLMLSKLSIVLPRGCWYGGPTKWAWQDLRKTLVTRCNH